MPRIRTLKPEALQHRKLGRVSDRAFRLWTALLTQADDEGRLVADTEQLRLFAFGYQPRVHAGHVEAALAELVTAGGGGLVVVYGVARVRYACLPSWKDHQKISHPTPSVLPPGDAPDAVGFVVNGTGRLQSPLEDSGALQNLPEHSGISARAGADRIGSDRIGSEGSVAHGARRKTPEDSGAGSAPPAGASPRPPAFQIPEPILTALERAPRFRAVPALHRPAFWQSQLRACPTVDHASELLKAHAWIEANPRRAPKRDLPRFVHRWLMKAAEDADGE